MGGDAGSSHRIAISYGQFTTEVEFSDRRDFVLHEKQVVASWSMGLRDGWGVGASVGLVIDGDLRGKAGRFDVQPGFVFALRGSKVWLQDERWWPFISTSVAVAVGWVGLQGLESGVPDEASVLAFDLRADLTIGKTLWRTLTPYVSVRAFGAPLVLLDGDVTSGSDPHHYQLAFGAQVTLPGGVAVYVDWAPLGERSLSLGLSAPLP